MRVLARAALGVLVGISSVDMALLGLERVTWWSVLKALMAPVVAAALHPPKREAVAFLWLFGAGVVVTLSLALGMAPRSLPRSAFGLALLGLAWIAFRRARQHQRQA